jgi:tetratricopeptide (TPR) repeat protein
MNKQLTTILLLLVAITFSAQKLKLTEAATEYKNNYSQVWMMQPDQLSKNKAILLKAKDAIDESFSIQLTKPFVKPKDLTKMYYYRGMIYSDYIFMAGMDEALQNDLEAIGQEKLYDAAFGSLIKCFEMDDKNQWKNPITRKIEDLRKLSFNIAADSYNEKDFKNSLKLFERCVQMYNVLSKPDTVAMINAANAAKALMDYDIAYKYYRLCADNNFGNGSEMYQYMLISLYSMADIDRDLCLNIIDLGKSKFPGDYGMSVEEYNFWLKLGEVENANNAIQNALIANPDNIALQYNVGVLFDGLCTKHIDEKNLEKATLNFEKAVESYRNVIELDSMYENGEPYYLIGRLHVYLAQEINSVNLQLQKPDDLLSQKADSLLKSAFPILENQLKNFPISKDPLNVLKIIYAQLSMENDYARIKKMIEEL